MDTERWKRIREIFEKALEMEPEERDPWIESACSGDKRLLQSVKKMLSVQEESESLIQPPEMQKISSTIDERLGEAAVGTRVGAYEIRRVIASGGMGTVYEALQLNPRRVVALKMMRRGLASASALRRFQYESELLAKLRHPGIAQVFEAGTHIEGEGPARREFPFFAMEYIEDARDILGYARDKNLAMRDRLELFIKVCEGVQHGHQRGVIHRDLKPGNILVDSAGQPKIIDFGVARAIDADAEGSTLLTETGQLMGTLQYMSPEQLKADPHEVDTRCDIYALGVLLYELLTGQIPYDVHRKLIHEAARIITEDPPRKPGAIDPSLSGELEWMMLLAMEKERDRRYRSVAEFAADIGRYLENQPVLAGPPSRIYRLRKFIQRHRIGVLAGAAIALSLITATVLSALATVRANESRAKMEVAYEEKERQRKLAEEEAARVRSAMSFLHTVLSTSIPGRIGSNVRVLEALDEAESTIKDLFIAQPTFEAEVRHLLGFIYLNNGVYEKAVEQLGSALALRRENGLGESPRSLEAMSLLSETLLLLDRISEAKDLCGRAFEIQERILGPDHKDTLNSAVLLARILRTQSSLEESEAMLRDAVTRAGSTLGDEDPITVLALHSLALTLQVAGKFEESEKLCLRALEIKQRHKGMCSPDAVLSLTNLAHFYQQSGRWEEAEKVNREAYELGSRIWDEDHPTMLAISNNLAVILRRNGKYEEAADLYATIIDLIGRTFGPTHRNALTASLNYATLLIEDLKRYDEAERICRDILAKVRETETLGPEHPLALEAANSLGTVLQDSGRLSEAEEVLKELVPVAWRVLPAHAYEPGWYQGNYAGCLFKQKRYAEAEQAYFKSCERLVPVLGMNDPRTRKIIKGLLAMYQVLEQPEKAKAFLERMQKKTTNGQ